MSRSDGVLTAALLPVKNPANAKQRLAGLFTASEREGLARVMFARTLRVLCGCQEFDRVIVLAQQAELLDAARRQGADAWSEGSQVSHSDSANAAAGKAAAEGIARLLLCPIDVPLVERRDVEAILEASFGLGTPSFVIAPSADDTGTNALACSPPGVVPARFGPGSRKIHETAARERNVPSLLHRSTAWRHDLDTPADMRRLYELGLSGEVRQFLDGIGADDRLRRTHA